MLTMLVALLTGCAPSPASIKLEGEPTVTVHALDAVALEKASVLDANGAAIEGQTVTWTVTPDTIAKLEGDKVTPIANGEATLTAALGDLKAEYKLVVALPDSIAIAGYDAAAPFAVGETKQLTATVKAGEAAVEGQTIAWSTDHPEFVNVDAATGLATAVAAGTATISATSGALTQSIQMTVGGAATPPVADAAAPK
jgi:hypothetical protein